MRRNSWGPGDQDGSGTLSFRETFIGLALLLSPSHEQRMECAFMMMDANSSGRVSLDELHNFLQYIAPLSTSKYDIAALSEQALSFTQERDP